jgi:acetylglutamate kinase
MKKLSIIKIGGNIIDEQKKLSVFLQNFSKLEGCKILVHGGGKIASELSKKMGIKPQMHEGRRITDKASLEITTMVYAGLLNKQIVAKLQSINCNAIGLSGADGNTITAEKRPVKEIDYGFVGDVTSIGSKNISKLINADFVPVFNAVTHNNNGQLLNTNADTIASELAVGLAGIYDVELLYLFEKDGVLSDLEKNIVIEKIDKEQFEHLKNTGIIHQGMIPKLHNCFYALENGVNSVKIAGEKYLSKATNTHTKILI